MMNQPRKFVVIKTMNCGSVCRSLGYGSASGEEFEGRVSCSSVEILGGDVDQTGRSGEARIRSVYPVPETTAMRPLTPAACGLVQRRFFKRRGTFPMDVRLSQNIVQYLCSAMHCIMDIVLKGLRTRSCRRWASSR